jgi:hypothetical protein
MRLARFVRAVREGDEQLAREMVLRLSQSHRLLTPLAFVVGGFEMLFTGLKLLLTNWRLTLVQILPAMWIWVAMFDLKAHALHGRSLTVLRGPVLIPIVLVIAAITAAGFFLNAVFGFAIVGPGPPEVRPALAKAPHCDPRVGHARRLAARLLDDGCHPLGTPVVRDLVERRHRRDDGLLRGRPGAADRRDATLFEA